MAVVGHDRVVLVTAPSHPLASVHPLTLTDVRQAEFMVTEIGCIYRQLFDEVGRDVGPSLKIAMITGSLNSLRRLTVNGRGAALLPRFSVAAQLESGDLVMLDLKEGLAPLTIEARWRDGIGPAEAPLMALVALTQKYSPATWAMA
jgi:DNA-binding transcriptional LysR family regulator